MFVHPQIEPIALSIGPVDIRWYGLMYLFAFTVGGLLAMKRARLPRSGWSTDEVSDFVFYSALGVILGGRIGYSLFYNFSYYIKHPVEIFYLWNGGMSFHGGLIGVAIALFFYARHTKRRWFEVTDFFVPLAPLGIGAVRIANFINEELWGRVTSSPWGVIFPSAGLEPRHASQLYEALFEGFVLFVILWFYTQKKRSLGRPSGLFLVGYGVARFTIEFFREPDAHLGFIAFDWLTTGQLLTIPMIGIGLWLMLRSSNTSN
jgi:phosphatidylglycerol:prolipoprotein diacylglycerol transferase